MTKRIHISDRGLSVTCGQNATDLLHATLSQLNLSQEDENTLIESEDGGVHHPVFSRLPDHPSEEMLIDEVLDQLEQLSRTSDQLWLLLPDASQPNYPPLHLALYGKQLPSNCTPLSPEQLGERLQQGCQTLRQGGLNRLTLLGVDSLTSLSVAQYYLQNQRLRTQDYADGQILGQGWAWFTLSNEPAPQEPVVEWKQAAIQQAPLRDADGLPSGQMLAACIQKALEQPEQPLAKPHVWLHASRHTPEADLETFLAHRQLWSTKGTPFQNLQHLLPARTLGNLGVAALPMAINLACERLFFPLQPVQEILLMDSQPDGTRLAIHLQKSTTPTTGSTS